MKEVKNCWDLIGKYETLASVQELRTEVRHDFLELHALCGDECESWRLLMCYEFVKAFDVFLSNPDYYVSHRVGVLKSCVDQDGWDLFPRMVQLYRQAGGVLAEDVF